MPERSQAGMAPRRRAEIHVTLLGAFALRVGDRQRVLPKGVRRLIALLALNRDGLDRPTAASLLTPHLPPKNAAGSLRTMLSRLRGAGLQMLEKDRSTLRLAPHVTVDCWELEVLAARLLDGAPEPPPHDDSSDLARELLPEFDDPWVRQERARLRDLGLHALETYGRKQAARGELVAALSMLHRVRAPYPAKSSALSTRSTIGAVHPRSWRSGAARRACPPELNRRGPAPSAIRK